jgi:hypothetical protein
MNGYDPYGLEDENGPVPAPPAEPEDIDPGA